MGITLGDKLISLLSLFYCILFDDSNQGFNLRLYRLDSLQADSGQFD